MLDGVQTSFSTTRVVCAALVLFVAYRISSKLYLDARLRKLGARAPIRRSWLPLSADVVYEVISHILADELYEMWLKLFANWSPHQWTMEAGVGERVIVTAEPENIKAILATQFKEYGKGPAFHKDFEAFLGNGIFNVDGHQWHDSRQLIRPQFVKDRLSDLDIFEEHVQVLLQKISATPQVEMMDLFFRYTLDAATHFLLGKSVDSLHQPQTAFAEAFSQVQKVQGLIARLGPLSWLVPKKRMNFYGSLKTLDDFVNIFIEKALALTPQELEEMTKHDEGYTFLHAIAAYTRDRKTLRDQLVSILLAGRDTTACTLAWAIYELSLQPHIVEKLRNEIIEKVGLERTPTYADLKDMKYLQHTLNETLRLYPVVPYNVRVALQDTTLPVGGGPDGLQPVAVLKGTPIGYSTLVMQRRTDIYPPLESGFPAVDKFVPERWDHWTPQPWTYVPFNGGPRICIGQNFALTEMGYTLVRLLQKFEKVENRMDGPQTMHSDIVLQPGKPLTVAFS